MPKDVLTRPPLEKSDVIQLACCVGGKQIIVAQDGQLSEPWLCPAASAVLVRVVTVLRPPFSCTSLVHRISGAMLKGFGDAESAMLAQSSGAA